MTNAGKTSLAKALELGQSIWLDSIDREMVEGGRLDQLVSKWGLRGLTSNPAIFEKAMTRSTFYDPQLKELLKNEDLSPTELFEALAIHDIQMAADCLRPVFDQSGNRDGFVSFEVSPNLAMDSAATVFEARRLWSRINRPNLLIKVPGTTPGLTAIRELISTGINVNVTLLFSRARYREVAWAFQTGLRQRLERGQPVGGISSVASFFVSRIDTAVDRELSRVQSKHPEAGSLMGKIGIDNAKLAYEDFRQLFSDQGTWKDLAAAGAQPQRLLWASTGVKNRAYPDTLYVDELMGPLTVNTLPMNTLESFMDHGKADGKIEPRLVQRVDASRQRLEDLEKTGISLDKITDQLLTDAILLFKQPFEKLLLNLNQKRKRWIPYPLNPMTTILPSHDLAKVGGELNAWLENQNVNRLWAKDATLWTGKDEASWLGWLRVDEKFFRTSHVVLDDLTKLRELITEEGCQDIVLLGMGGSSLAAEVLDRLFMPQVASSAARPRFHVLDSTDPEQIAALEKKINPSKSIFIVSSKSGTTLEPNLFFEYFASKIKNDRGNHFIAITDPGSALEKLAKDQEFKAVFYGDPEIGGRYSALSNFGIVPAALMGADITRLIENARAMRIECGPDLGADRNPGAVLGITLAVLAREGRDKITFICSESISPLGDWLEQLLAESTGKQGKGLIPIAGENLATPETYSEDRVFVDIRMADDPNLDDLDQSMDLLVEAGFPVIRILLQDPYNIAQEFFRWEFATAIAGALLKINPFDQPDVEASKAETRKLTQGPQGNALWSADHPFCVDREIECFADPENAKSLRQLMGAPQTSELTFKEVLSAHLCRIQPGDYFAILAYLNQNPEAGYSSEIESIRETVRAGFRVATSVGFGPKFLHSTGQLHKGGSNQGVFLELTGAIPKTGVAGLDRFGKVQLAQAVGDLRVLDQRGRRTLHLHFKNDRTAGLKQLREMIFEIVSELSPGVSSAGKAA